MEGVTTIGEGRFLRPRVRWRIRGGEKFHGVVKRMIRIAFQLLLVSFLLLAVHWVYVTLLEAPYFQIKEVEVIGAQKIPKEMFLSLPVVEGMPNIFSIKLKEVVKPFESHPWVEQVKARKIFPNKIMIQIEEKKPMAIIQLEELFYIDSQGEIFAPVGDRDEFDYPYLTGLTREALENDPTETSRLIQKAIELLTIVNQKENFIFKEISEIHMDKNFGIRWFTREEGVEIKMGWEDFGDKIRRLSLVWSDLRNRGWEAASIDCRELNRMVVKKLH